MRAPNPTARTPGAGTPSGCVGVTPNTTDTIRSCNARTLGPLSEACEVRRNTYNGRQADLWDVRVGDTVLVLCRAHLAKLASAATDAARAEG